ncbi:MAG: hypothetical protein U0325_23175 [Polyangiales bacterium]
MSSELQSLLGAVVAVVVVVVPLVLRAEARAVREGEALWARYAARRGGVHHPGVWGNGGWRRSPVLELPVGQAHVTVDTLHDGTSDNGRVSLRVRAPWRRAAVAFELGVPGLVASPGRVSLGGDDGFDARFAVRTEAPAAVAHLWSPAARALLTRHLHGMGLHVRGDAEGITLTVRDLGRNEALLHAAVEVVAALAQP